MKDCEHRNTPLSRKMLEEESRRKTGPLILKFHGCDLAARGVGGETRTPICEISDWDTTDCPTVLFGDKKITEDEYYDLWLIAIRKPIPPYVESSD